MRGKWFHNNSLRFLKYGLALIACLFLWAGVILINEQNWVALSALATLILALAAFWAIWQNYSLHKRERKERLLNEIIEWAWDVLKLIPKDVLIGTDVCSGLELITQLQALEEGKGAAILHVVEREFSKTESVGKELIEALTKAIDGINAYRTNLPPKSSAEREIFISELSYVIKIATETRDKL